MLPGNERDLIAAMRSISASLQTIAKNQEMQTKILSRIEEKINGKTSSES